MQPNTKAELMAALKRLKVINSRATHINNLVSKLNKNNKLNLSKLIQIALEQKSKSMTAPSWLTNKTPSKKKTLNSISPKR